MQAKNNTIRQLAFLLMMAVLAVATGCAGAPPLRETQDPWEGFNRGVFHFNKMLDETLAKPVATGYKAIMPAPLDKGVTNFFSNLDDVVVVFNDLLQAKFEQALMDTTRFVWNSTWGLLGFIDVAGALGLPKNREDFGQTLAVWGFESGPFLMLPFLGPSTVRDGVGKVPDFFLVNPLYNSQEERVRWGLVALNAIDKRADLLGATSIVDTAALDEYAFIRDAFLQQRRFLIYDGNPPEDEFDEEFFEDEFEESDTEDVSAEEVSPDDANSETASREDIRPENVKSGDANSESISSEAANPENGGRGGVDADDEAIEDQVPPTTGARPPS